MIFLVEGLNCSGKTFWIKNKISQDKDLSQHLITSWLNPRRYLGLQSSYTDVALYIGYISTIKCIETLAKPVVYWDRTFLSAYAYGTITMDIVYRIIDALQESTWNTEIVFLNTPIQVCKDRWEKENKFAEKPYAKVDDQEKILDRLQEVILEVSTKFGIERMDINYQGEKNED